MSAVQDNAALRPNVLFITADQWRGDCLSSLNHPIVRTPHLDALAAEAVQFRKHFANAVPCGPSRASLHTGLYLHNHRSGTNGTPLDGRFNNWALELRGLGYDPVLFGYTHTSVDPRGIDSAHPVLRNDEGPLPGIRPVIDMGTLCPDWRAYLQEQGYELPAVDGATYSMRAPGEDLASTPSPLAISAEHSDTHFLVDRVLNHIAASDEPWCVHLSLRAPHPPWVAPAPYHERYAIDDLPQPVGRESLAAEQSLHPWLQEHLANRRNQRHVDEVRHRKLQASYYGLMSEVDDNMGRLIATLKERGEWDDTIFIFTSDHGEQMGDHWLYGKAGFFDQSFHIPLIIACPGVKPAVCDEFTEHVDIFPTLMDLLGVEVPRQCDGQSLQGALTGHGLQNWRSAACYEYDFRHSPAENVLGLDMEEACLNVVRDDNYKYVHFADLPALLFDLDADPEELTDIAAEQPDIVVRYAQRLLSWRMKTTDKTLSHLQISREHGLRDLSKNSSR